MGVSTAVSIIDYITTLKTPGRLSTNRKHWGWREVLTDVYFLVLLAPVCVQVCWPRDHCSICQSCLLSWPSVFNANLRLLMEGLLQRTRWVVCVSVRDMLNFTRESHSKPPLNQILCDATVCALFLSLFSPGASAINSELFRFFPPRLHTRLLSLC